MKKIQRSPWDAITAISFLTTEEETGNKIRGPDGSHEVLMCALWMYCPDNDQAEGDSSEFL
jgi:hypothetical protein